MSVREIVQRWIDAPITIQRNSPPHDLLNNLLSGTASISLLALILSPIIGWQTASGKALGTTSLVLLVGTAAAFVINRHSSFPAGVLFLLLITTTLIGVGAGATGLVIPVLLPSILLRPWASLVAASLGSLAAMALPFSLAGYILETPSLLTLFTVALVSWLATRSLERALHDRRQSDRRLAESKERFRRMAESIQDGLTIIEQGQVVYLNDRICEITGRSREELATMSSLDFVAPEERERLQQVMDKARQTGSLPARLEFWIERPDGTRRRIHNRYTITLAPERQGSSIEGSAGERWKGGLVDRYVVTTDVTERRQMEERLRQTQKMEAMGRLAAGVAHDFNNYLTVIDSYVDLLRMDLKPGASMRHELGEIAKAVELSKALTCQLLAFSRQQTGLAGHPQVLCVNEVIARTEDILRRLAGNDVDLVIQTEPHVGLVRADSGQIEQILTNLVTNARDAVAGTGTITIQTENADAEGVTIVVSDTGEGIDAEALPHIFEPFFTTKEAGCGTGLGLSTVYSIVRQIGGHIAVESAVGRGTAFRIYLPRVEDK
jgi:PAS domain S-box-containing protein